MKVRLAVAVCGLSCLALAQALAVNAAELRPDQVAFRGIYKELVETNTAMSVGSCTEASEKMAARLKAAGYPESDLHLFATPEFPKDGGIVAILPGTDPKAKAVLLLAHIDVVEAKREDWVRDPFTLIEEDGKFYARGTSDDKIQAAIWTDTLIRFRQEGFKPRTTVKMALTCGEESGRFNGAIWLTQNWRDLIDAEFAINEGGGLNVDAAGKPVSLSIEAAEKATRNYHLDVVNPGGHSSKPVKDNAIYHLAHAITQVEQLEFPFQFIDANRSYFSGMANILKQNGDAETANAMQAMLKEPIDVAAAAKVAAKDPTWNSMLRTTCVATMLDGGHATNALPQHAGANINCRVFPGVSDEAVRLQIEKTINDPAVKVTMAKVPGQTAPAPALLPRVIDPAKKLMAEFWPGVPVLPTLVTGGTDGRYLNAVGIPTFGIDGSADYPDSNHIHGLNEYADVASVYKDRDFLYRLVKAYVGG
jgi:acetylornithine deacetylase/succinyl-diaminopimelate desuccinylase-like protein